MKISEKQERLVIELLSLNTDHQWECSKCEEEITMETGWKPRVSFYLTSRGTVSTCGVEVWCGPCVLIEGSKLPAEDQS